MSYNGKWLKNPTVLLFEVRDRVARITMNRPDKRNALSRELVQELHDAFLEADDRADVNVIVLSGAGKDFCAGYDLGGTYEAWEKEKAANPDADLIPYRSINTTLDDDIWNMERSQELLRAPLDVHKPIIAKLQGNCVAGGTDLALMCDLLIAADDAKIGFPATRANGTPPNHMWIYHVGPQWAKRLLLSGDRISGEDAAVLGLVLESHPADELDAAVDALAERLAHNDPELLSAQKGIVNFALDLMGARTVQRQATIADGQAHLTKGPRRVKYHADRVEHGMKVALQGRDAPFGDGMVRLNRKRRNPD